MEKVLTNCENFITKKNSAYGSDITTTTILNPRTLKNTTLKKMFLKSKSHLFTSTNPDFCPYPISVF